jgi:hypothetical protein
MVQRLLWRASAASVAFALAACTNGSQTGDASSQPSAAPTAQPPVWRVPYAPKGGDVITQVQATGDTVVATARLHVLAFDAGTGTRLWQVSLRPENALAQDAMVFAGTEQNGVVAIALRTGAVAWRSPRVCPPATSRVPSVPYLVLVNASSVFAGCPGGRLLRIDRASGRIATARDVFSADQFTGGATLGPGAIVVEGYGTGATTVGRVAVVRAADLKPIVARSDAAVLGLVGNTMMVDDFCCLGRILDEAPAALLRVDLATGRVAPPIDLQPDPVRFGPDRRPIGAGAHAALVGGRLYLALPPALYDYGSAAQRAAKPAQVLDTLVAPPAFMTHGRALVQLRSENGITSELLDLAQRPPSVVWKRTAESPFERAECPPQACFGNQFADLVMLSGRPEDPAVIVRWDGATAVVPNGCNVFAPSGDAIVTACLPRLLDANGSAPQYLAAFKPAPP